MKHKAPDDADMRLMVYSHDTLGLGHLRRCMALIRVLVDRFDNLSVLLVTGSPFVHNYPMPPCVDYLKLPSLQKVGVSRYEARSLEIPGMDLVQMRSSLIQHTVRDYQPNALLVDHAPAGAEGELLPTLDWLAQTGDCVRILGLRDIIDDPTDIMNRWRENGTYELIEHSYDRVLIYGDPAVFDTIKEYAFPSVVARKSTFLEYVCSSAGDPPVAAPAGPASEQPFVLVTIGGGDGGGDTVVIPFLEMLRRYAGQTDFRAEILTGPFLDIALRPRIEKLARDLPVKLHELLPSTRWYQQNADVVISTAGYNTVTDVLSYAQRSILIPRVLYRKEQLIRSQQLARLSLCSFLHPDEATPDRLFAAVQESRAGPGLAPARDSGLPLHGTENFADFFDGLQLGCRPRTPAAR